MIDCGGVRGCPLRRGGGEQRSANQGEAFPFPNHQSLITNHFLVSFAFFCGILYLKIRKICNLLTEVKQWIFRNFRKRCASRALFA